MLYEKRCSYKLHKFTGKHLCQNLFFNKFAGLRAATLLKKNSRRCIFLWILRNFEEHLTFRTPLDDCFWFYLWCVFIFSIIKSFRHEKRGFVRKKLTTGKPAEVVLEIKKHSPGGAFFKKVILKISQNSQENTMLESLFS